MDRLSVLDAEFLLLEDENSPMHIAGVCVFENPPPPLVAFRSLLESKLHLIPRYRQCVRTVPLELGRPVWVDDQRFNIDYHLRHTALPAAGDDAELSRLMGRIMSQPLDHQRPLWEAWLVEGLAGGRWALIFKVHHCMVDGIAGVGLLTVLLEAEATMKIADPEPWAPAPEPLNRELILGAWRGLADDAFGLLRHAPERAAHPLDTFRSAIHTGEGFLRFATKLLPARPSSIEGSIGPHRSWAHSSASLGDIASIRAVYGGTINDVILTAVTGGYRELLLSRGEDPDLAVVRSGIPVSVRRDADHDVADNEVSALLYELPVHLADPVERLALIHDQMAELKVSHMTEAGEALTSFGNLAPPMLVGPATRLAVRAERSVPQRVVNTVTTNVPGPQFPLYCLGREMLEYQPYVPISYGVRIGTAILSYNGQVFFGITGDYDTASDVAVIADAASAGIAELRDRALTSSPPRKRR